MTEALAQVQQKEKIETGTAVMHIAAFTIVAATALFAIKRHIGCRRPIICVHQFFLSHRSSTNQSENQSSLAHAAKRVHQVWHRSKSAARRGKWCNARPADLTVNDSGIKVRLLIVFSSWAAISRKHSRISSSLSHHDNLWLSGWLDISSRMTRTSDL